MKIARRCVCCDGARLARSPAVLAPFIAHRVFGWEPVEITAGWGLRDIRQGSAYSVCNTLECADCGLLFLDMRFDDDEMSALYAGYRGPDYTAMRDRYEPGYAERNKHYEAGSPYIPSVEAFLAPHLPARPRVLDHGGDTGLNTPFRGRAERHHVYEISGHRTVEGARSVSLEEARAERFDLVVSMQVLEHVPQPIEPLREMAACMSANTLLYVEVPREDIVRTSVAGVANAPRKRHWHEHINFFTEAALDALLGREGLRVVARDSSPVVAGGREVFVQRVLARLK